MLKSDSEYLAIKLVGLDHWLWFERAKVTENEYGFEGKDGWGLGGAHTDVQCPTNLIEARLNSKELQYQ